MNIPEDMVLTPGGLRPKSRVHLIEPGHILDETGGRLRKLDPSGQVVADFGTITPRPGNEPLMPGNVAIPLEEVPALGSGWIAYASWTNTTGNPISSFITTWNVPPAPATQSGQLIYLFNGIQNSTMILQPVLQWGNNGLFGGNYWGVASWYADGQNGNAYYSSYRQVVTGDSILGRITLTGHSGSLFSYNCQFQGIANSGYTVQNVQELIQAVETLETYGITQCSDYPNTADTAFLAIVIQTGSTNPTLIWSPVNSVTDCGQHTVVVSNSNPSSEVDIHYSTQFLPNEDWTHGAYYGSRGTYFADVNGDGMADAIAVNDNGVFVRLSNGTGFDPVAKNWTGGAYYGSRGTYFADVNRDRQADAIVVNDNTVTVRRAS